MKRYLILVFLLIPSIVWAAPSNTMSITPAATDATVITASDENTRNSNISTPYNAHDHIDITQTGNTLKVGDGTAGNKTIQANNADTNKPFLRYDDTNDRWVASQDGTIINSIVIVTGNSLNGFTLPETIVHGDILFVRDNARYEVLNAGTAGQKLETQGANAPPRWVTLSSSKIQDSDGDTKVDTEESGDEDIIRMDTAGTQRWIMTAAGERTMPTQPAFTVSNGSTVQSNIPVGSETTIDFGTEITDQGSNFAANTFTAPVTGNYLLTIHIALASIDSASTSISVRLKTSNRNYDFTFDPNDVFSADTSFTFGISVVADMDANDTVLVRIIQTGGAQQMDITTVSYFTGALIN